MLAVYKILWGGAGGGKSHLTGVKYSQRYASWFDALELFLNVYATAVVLNATPIIPVEKNVPPELRQDLTKIFIEQRFKKNIFGRFFLTNEKKIISDYAD